MEASRLCRRCGQIRPESEFNFKNRVRGTRQPYCRSSSRAQVRQHYRANLEYYAAKRRKRGRELYQDQRRRVLDYLAAHPCVDCGEADIVCLEFDHVRGVKRFSVAAMIGDYAWEAIEAEIAKCVVRCANCHRRKTARERGWYRVVQ